LLQAELTKEEEEKNATLLEDKVEVKVESKSPSKARGSIPFISCVDRTPSPMIRRRTRGRNRKTTNSNTSSTIDVASTLDMAGIQPGSSVSFQPGSNVFVLWKNGLYPAQILSKETNNSTSGGGSEQQENNNAYFVHYNSYHDDFDSWVPLSRIYKITKQTQRVFELSNRGNDNEELEIDSSGGSRGGNKRGGGGDRRMSTSTPYHTMERRNRSRTSGGGTTGSSTTTTKTSCTTSLSSTTTIDMGDIDSGVVFLPGSGVYVAWKMGLFQAKMLKRRKVSEETEYLVHYIGYSDSYDAWVPLSRIYEISPQTKRIFGRCKDVVLDSMDNDDEASSSSSTSEDDDDRNDTKQVGVETLSLKPKESCNHNNNSNRSKKTCGLFDVENVSPGVEFERGRAIYAEYKNVFYLAKMLKKRTRGKANHQYFVHYDGFRKSSDAWVSTGKVYEINSQTKRLFNAQRK